MSTRVVERVDDWDQEPFSGGYRELQERADAGFSGVFRANGAELFMTRGAVVGIRRGAIEDFEDASGTVFTAPTDALPLLAIMQERSDEVRAKYYTEETSISEVDGTLEDGGFTGYIELSENVLSGDYYVVYHRGQSMSVGFVGNNSRLITGDEAFETTDDEVGIYEVRPVDIDPIEIPEPLAPEPEPEPDAGAAAVTEAEEADADSPDSDRATATDPAEGVDTSATQPDDPAGATADDPAAAGVAADDGPTAEERPGDRPTEAGDSEGRAAEGAGAAGAGVGAAAGASDDYGTGAGPDEAAGQAGPGEETSASPDREGQSTGATGTGSDETAAERRRASKSLTEHGDADDTRETSAATETSRTEVSRTETTPEGSGTETTDEHTGSTGRGGEPVATPDADAAEAESVGRSQPQDTPDRTGRDAGTVDDRQSGGAAPSSSPESETANRQAVSKRERPDAAADDPGQLETRSIPSLDPERSRSPSRTGDQSRRDTPGRSGPSGGATATGAAADQGSQADQPSSEPTPQETRTEREPASDPESPESGAATEVDQETEPERAESGGGQPDSGAAERIEELEELLSERETELKSLEADLQSVESERDSLRRELEEVRQERDDLQAEVESLESELRRLEEELGAATDAQQRMTPQEALGGTDLFVRYNSKGDATLAKARDSGLRQQDVAGNLRLEKHTQFESDVAAVGGREYDEFLEDTVAFRFARWVVYSLLFEIQNTGHTDSLSTLYQALPQINRIELNGTVTATYTEDGEEVQSTESFDVVFRERMGDPLLVANINDSRQGATQGMMEQLITAAERVGQTSDQFAGAFLVTESFFEPEALETVEQATRGGLLSRDKRKSFVNLSRKNGYHLCLVEARNENFHLEVPEL